MTLPILAAGAIGDIASLLEIQDHSTGARARWLPNVEQRSYWEASEKHPFIYVAKARQVGLSTAVCLEDVLFVATCDAAGHRVRCAIVVDTYDKALERLIVCDDFARQLGLDCRKSDNALRFSNGSEILALSASADEVGRSLSVQRLHLTELPFWADPAAAYTSVMQGLSLGGRVSLETTMDTRTPFARDLWRDDKNDFHKVFLPVEMHDEYQADPASIDDERWAELQQEGFTSRAHAAWFDWAIINKVGGDVVRAFREYPQKVEHLFQASSGRWVKTTPSVVEHIDTLRTLGVNGDVWVLLIYRKPADVLFPFVAVDTASGKDRDRSVVVVRDGKDRALCGILVSGTIYADDLARVAHAAQVHYTRDDPMHPTKMKRPVCLIEQGGVGDVTCQMAERLGMAFDRVTTTEESRYQGLLESKHDVESGILVGPKDLAEECDELHVDDHGRFKGHKDILMACGFIGRRLRMSPVGVAPAPVESERKIDGKRMVRAAMRAERARAWR